MILNKKNTFLFLAILAVSRLSLAQTEVDNSKMNERDRSSAEMTADQQKFNESDTTITSRIRQEIMKEKNLSIYAQNIKTITSDGKVTLKGPVRSKFEKDIILRNARSIAGANNVLNEIAVTHKKTN
jgi:hyperosmotically inducible periplasmic protein